jgi:hypothetical protein
MLEPMVSLTVNREAGFAKALSSPEIRRMVEKELNHLSSYPGPQSLLRAMYWVHRVRSLEAGDVEGHAHMSILMGCVEAIRGRYRDFQPSYDKKFFG